MALALPARSASSPNTRNWIYPQGSTSSGTFNTYYFQLVHHTTIRWLQDLSKTCSSKFCWSCLNLASIFAIRCCILSAISGWCRILSSANDRRVHHLPEPVPVPVWWSSSRHWLHLRTSCTRHLAIVSHIGELLLAFLPIINTLEIFRFPAASLARDIHYLSRTNHTIT